MSLIRKALKKRNPKRRKGKPETFETRFKRCVRQVSKKSPKVKSPYAVCKKSVPKFKGKRKRILR